MGGQPYDGKPYIIPSRCPDGTLVESRILLSSNEATLYRDGCKTGAPRPILTGEIQKLQGKIRFRGLDYFE
jgi:hypothetical protein